MIVGTCPKLNTLLLKDLKMISKNYLNSGCFTKLRIYSKDVL